MRMSQECIDFVNQACKEKGYINRLYGIKKVGAQIYGKIDEDDDERWWFPLEQLSEFEEKMIVKFLDLGGKI